MAVYEVPLVAAPQQFTVALAGGVKYQFRLAYADAVDAGWTLDVSDSLGNPLVCGIPLVTGADLLAQYDYLGIGGKLFVRTDGEADAVPTFDNFGTLSHLYFQVD